ENFRLGCTPVVNLFEMTAEPIRLNQLQTEYPVVPKYGEVHGHEVYSVDRVESTGSYIEGPVEFQPFYALRHAAIGPRRDAFWYASRRPSLRENDDGTEVSLAFTDSHFRPRSPAVETITVHLSGTNRDLPLQLPFGGEHA